MFDVGFSELVLVGIVALLVIGPEQLPETVRTVMGWVNRIRRGFNEIKQEVQQELHNDAVMRQLRQTGAQLKQETTTLGRELADPLVAPAVSATPASMAPEPAVAAPIHGTNTQAPDAAHDATPASKVE